MSHEIVGKWRVTAIGPNKEKWIWEYVFASNGAVSWRDPFNNLSGKGKWSVGQKSIAVSWAPQSTTKEYWYLPISPSFQTAEYRASYGNGTIVAERLSRPQDDEPPHFEVPSWASSTAGAKVNSKEELWRQELELGGSASIALTSPAGLTLRMQNPKIASFTEFEDKANKQLGIQVVGTQPGDSYFEAVRGDTIVAQMQIHVSTVPSRKAPYIDDFATAYYDPDYAHQGGNFSKYVLLHFADETAVAVHVDRIVGAFMDDAARLQSIRSGGVGDGGRYFPTELNRSTTPRLYVAKQQALEIMGTLNYNIIKIGAETAMFIVSLGPGAVGGPLSPRQRIPRSKAPRSVRNAGSGGGGGGGGGGGKPKGTPAPIDGNGVRLGSPGQPGNLFASIQTIKDWVVYVVDMIVLSGEGAEVATARATHRAMIRRAAQTAKNAGKQQFKMVGKQANPNFRAHADGLANELGVPGSGRSVGSGPGYSDYEVILDVAKVLGGQP